MRQKPRDDITKSESGQPLTPYGKAAQTLTAIRTRKVRPGLLLAVIGLTVVVLWTAAPGTIMENTTRTRQSEALVILESSMEQARAARAKVSAHTEIHRLTGDIGSGGCGVLSAELVGKYYRVLDRIDVHADGARVYCEPLGEGNSDDPPGHLDFSWRPGDRSVLTWDR